MDVLGLSLANPSLQKAYCPHPYTTSIASSASSSSSSVSSLDCLSSQGSISSSSTTSVDVILENEVLGESQAVGLTSGIPSESGSHCFRGVRGCVPKVADTAVAPELRQHPRRTHHVAHTGNGSASACPRPPPSLVRQSERKVNFVDNLVDSASQIVETIWPLSVVALRGDSALGCKGVLPLRTFIQETLRRSRTSYSTLQVALYYLIMIKPFVPSHDFTMEQPRDQPCSRAMQCGRRMFLAALILASKYLQDRNYSARAWSKISGLNTTEINQNELAFLKAVQWRLHISEPIFQRWTDIVLKYTPPAGGSLSGECLSWRSIIPLLTPELDTVDLGSDMVRGIPCKDNNVANRIPPHLHTSIPAKPTRSWSSDQIPTMPRSLPSPLEPNPRMDYTSVPLPAYPKPSHLPTPQLTPQSSAASTPAVGAGGFCSRRPSMCAAISQAQNMCVARTTLDQRPPCMYAKTVPFEQTYPPLGRRSSLARSASSTSSPESMISDVPSMTSSRSTRSSRSSSISSTASGTCAPLQPRLAIRATRRCANLQANCLKESRKPLMIATPIDEGCYTDLCASPESFSRPGSTVPDLTNFSLGTPIDAAASAHEAAQGLCELSGALPRSHPVTRTPSPSRRCRKRGRPTSDDLSLQTNVRHLMSLGIRKNEDDGAVVVPDHQVADSFLIPQPKAVQSPSGCPLGTIKLPLPVSLPMSGGSMKRACFGQEAAKLLWGVGRNLSGSMTEILD